MPGELTTQDESFNPGELSDEGEGLFLEFGEDEGTNAGARGSEGGSGGTGAEAGTEGEGLGTGPTGGTATGESTPPAPVSVEQFNKALQEIAELRGRLASRDEARDDRSYERQQPDYSQQTQQQQQQQQAEVALRRRIKEISQKMYDPETAESAVEELLGLNAQLAQAQANMIVQQRIGSTQLAATDLLVENFLSRQEKKDELFNEIEPLFEKELAKYDRSQLVGRSRAELTAALEYLYKGVRADVLDAKFREAKERAQQRRAAAPKMGGGRGAELGGGRVAPRNGKATDSMRQFVKDAGFPEDQIEEILGSAFGGNEE